MQCNSTFRAQQIGNALDATHSKRVALKNRLTKRGLMRLFYGFGSGYKLNVAKRKREQHIYVLTVNKTRDRFTQILLMLINCASYCAPKLVATAAAFSRVGQNAVDIQQACNVPQVLPQLVVRKLIGFSGNN